MTSCVGVIANEFNMANLSITIRRTKILVICLIVRNMLQPELNPYLNWQTFNCQIIFYFSLYRPRYSCETFIDPLNNTAGTFKKKYQICKGSIEMSSVRRSKPNSRSLFKSANSSRPTWILTAKPL